MYVKIEISSHVHLFILNLNVFGVQLKQTNFVFPILSERTGL